MTIEIKRMWEGGPLREWSEQRPPKGKWIGYADDGFVGNYICEVCRRPVDGVYGLREPRRWVCGPCRDKVRPAKALDNQKTKR